ncbi:hypothetical protein [Branchiibius cervicis]|uniref:Uncharacterized protein n=1 Tax=Branchiibius cervicis TaxID=908252 RepID=A0ABW2AWE8_9MICO
MTSSLWDERTGDPGATTESSSATPGGGCVAASLRERRESLVQRLDPVR